MKRLILFSVLLCLTLCGCGGSSSETINTPPSEVAPTGIQNTPREDTEDLDLEEYILKGDAFDYVKENYPDEMKEWALEDMIGGEFEYLLEEVITDTNWDAVAKYLEANFHDEIEDLVTNGLPPDSPPPPPLDDYVKDYVINTHTGKFHLPDCNSVDEMLEHNKENRTTTRDQLIAEGYSPCGNCNP